MALDRPRAGASGGVLGTLNRMSVVLRADHLAHLENPMASLGGMAPKAKHIFFLDFWFRFLLKCFSKLFL